VKNLGKCVENMNYVEKDIQYATRFSGIHGIYIYIIYNRYEILAGTGHFRLLNLATDLGV